MLLQSIPEMREAFLIKTANGSWRLPRIGELCCRRPKLAQTLDKSECCSAYHLGCSFAGADVVNWHKRQGHATVITEQHADSEQMVNWLGSHLGCKLHARWPKLAQTLKKSVSLLICAQGMFA
jgi:hypothetical protein